MGKFPTSLLVIVLELYLISGVSADEEVRKVQEALRKRHLFFGDASGESSPVLTSAIARYQQNKGFTPTGVIDFETGASLGIARAAAPLMKAPFVVQGDGEARDANGQPLPDSVAGRSSLDNGPVQFGRAPIDIQNAFALPASNNSLNRRVDFRFKQRSRTRPQRVQPRKETNPIFLAFHTVDHAMKFLLGANNPKKKRFPVKPL